QVRATGKVRESAVDIRGAWRMDGDNPGTATVRFSRMSIESLRDLLTIGGEAEEQQSAIPFEGFLEGGAELTVAIGKPRDFRATLSIDTVQLNAKATQALRLG